MDQSSKSKTYLFEESKSGHLVPVVDGIYMHSMLDPIKEAYSFAEQHSEEIQRNPVGLVFGIGFGYHIHSIIEKYRLFHGEKSHWKIGVVESDPRCVLGYLEYQAKQYPELAACIQIYCAPVAALYNDRMFLDLLLQKPQIVIHKPSYQKNLSFYHEVLKFRRNNEVGSISSSLNQELLDYFPFPTGDQIHTQLEHQEFLNRIEVQDYWSKSEMFSILLHALGNETRRKDHAEK